MTECINLTRGIKQTIIAYRYWARLFDEFISENYPKVINWSDIRPSMLVAYLRSLQDRGLSYHTIQNAFKPIKKASIYWSIEKPELYRDIVRSAGRSLTVPKPPYKPLPVLNRAQLKAFLDWLKTENRFLHPMACLMGMAGLRMLEAAAIRHCDLDWGEKTVRVDKTAHHVPKNRGSYRTVPIHPDITKAIHEWIKKSKTESINPEDPVFLNQYGKPWKYHALRTAWRRVMDSAQSNSELSGLENFQPHRLRASFATIARNGKGDIRALQRYLGHAPADILGEHYEFIGVRDLQREVIDAFDRIWTVEAHADRQKTGTSKS